MREKEDLTKVEAKKLLKINNISSEEKTKSKSINNI